MTIHREKYKKNKEAKNGKRQMGLSGHIIRLMTNSNTSQFEENTENEGRKIMHMTTHTILIICYHLCIIRYINDK